MSGKRLDIALATLSFSSVGKQRATRRTSSTRQPY
jgi:hypothetical protein